MTLVSSIKLPVPDAKGLWSEQRVRINFSTDLGFWTSISPHLLMALNEDEKAGWIFLASRTETTMREYADHKGRPMVLS